MQILKYKFQSKTYIFNDVLLERRTHITFRIADNHQKEQPHAKNFFYSQDKDR